MTRFNNLRTRALIPTPRALQLMHVSEDGSFAWYDPLFFKYR